MKNFQLSTFNFQLSTFWLLTLLWSVVGGPWSAFGQLTTTVYPGYTLQPGERITVDKLNLLGSPTVVVSGSSTGQVISAGSITSASITTNAFDQSTIVGGWDGSAATAIRVNYDTNTLGFNAGTLGVKSNGITAAQVATNALRNYHWLTNWLDAVNVNGTVTVNTSATAAHTNFYLLTAASSNVGTNGSPTNTALALTSLGTITASATFTNAVNAAVTNALVTTATVAFTNSFPYLTPKPWTNAHGLGRIPSDVRIVYQCLSNIGVWVTGDEIDAENAASGYVWKAHSATATPTNVIVRLYNYNGMSVTTSDATIVGLTTNYWRMKMYVTP